MYKNKRVAVIGLGVSGLAAARLLKDIGARVRVTESAVTKAILERKNLLVKEGVSIEVGGHNEKFIKGSQLFVVSPGVDRSSLPLRFARKNQIPVIDETEFAWTLCPGKVIAVSGTNGKTTVVSLLGEIFKKAKKGGIVCGNIGNPFSSAIAKCRKNSLIILEISSFQLERIKNFRPKIAVLLNIAFDHLDRHQSFLTYQRTKARLFLNQKSDDYAVLNQDDAGISPLLPCIKANKVFFSMKKRPEKGLLAKKDWIISNLSGEEQKIFDLKEAILQGQHNVENYLAAASVALLCKIPLSVINRAFTEFYPLPHRLEFVKRINEVTYIDDSKATNVSAAKAALSSFPAGRIILILGGRDKGCSFSPLKKIVEEKVKTLILLGEAKERIKSQLKNVPIRKVNSLEEAVKLGKKLAKPGDFVLLSPACSSFDMFIDYKQRGNVFKRAVQNLS